MHICWLWVGVKDYWVWCEKSRRVITPRDVKFDMYQPIESTSHKVQRSKRYVKPTKIYIEECDYVAYAHTIVSEVHVEDDLGFYKEAMGIVDASKWLGVMIQEM